MKSKQARVIRAVPNYDQHDFSGLPADEENVLAWERIHRRKVERHVHRKRRFSHGGVDSQCKTTRAM